MVSIQMVQAIDRAEMQLKPQDDTGIHVADVTRPIKFASRAAQTFRSALVHALADFVILIFLSYQESPTHSELTATVYDLQCILSFLGFTHQNPARRFFILTDFDCHFSDRTGDSRPLPVISPTWTNIGTVVRYAAREGGSGLICFGGHSDRDQRGSYLILPQGQRVYGHEFRSWLPRSIRKGAAIKIVLDACKIGRFLSKADLPVCYDGTTATAAGEEEPKSGHIILISGARENQYAGTRNVSFHSAPAAQYPHGALVWFLLQNLRMRGPMSAQELVARLITDCRLPPGHPIQQPCIFSSRPILGEIHIV